MRDKRGDLLQQVTQLFLKDLESGEMPVSYCGGPVISLD